MIDFPALKKSTVETWQQVQSYLTVQNVLTVILSSVVLSFAFKTAMQLLMYANVFFIFYHTLQPSLQKENPSKLSLSLRLLALGMALLPVTLGLSTYLSPLLFFVLNAPLTHFYIQDIREKINTKKAKEDSTTSSLSPLSQQAYTIACVLRENVLDLIVVTPIFHRTFIGALHLLGLVPVLAQTPLYQNAIAILTFPVFGFAFSTASKFAGAALFHKHQTALYQFAHQQVTELWSKLIKGQIPASQIFSSAAFFSPASANSINNASTERHVTSDKTVDSSLRTFLLGIQAATNRISSAFFGSSPVV